MDFATLFMSPTVWTGLAGIIAAVGTFQVGRSSRRKTEAEAHKVEVETNKLQQDISDNAEQRIRDQIVVSFGKLTEGYEHQMDMMSRNLTQMGVELNMLSNENKKLKSTVDELSSDNDTLRQTVAELRLHIEKLITVMRQNGVSIIEHPELALPPID